MKSAIEQHNPALNKLINELCEALRPVVETIHRGPALTKDHYGEYMGAITQAAKIIPHKHEMQAQLHLAIGLAMIRAGANRLGVTSALRVMGAL